MAKIIQVYGHNGEADLIADGTWVINGLYDVILHYNPIDKTKIIGCSYADHKMRPLLGTIANIGNYNDILDRFRTRRIKR